MVSYVDMGNFDPDQLGKVNLGQNLLLEASAGTGKTYALERVVVQLLRSGIPLRHLVVLTFTKKAAGELSFRVHRRLSECCASSQGEERELLRQALYEFPTAQISTFHSFIQRLLEEAPLQLRVSPQLKIDDLSYQRLFRRLVQKELARPFSEELQRSFRARYGDKKDFDEVLAHLSQGYFFKFLCGNADVQLFPGAKAREEWERVGQDFIARRGGFAVLEGLAQLSWPVDLFGKSKKNGGVQVLPGGGVTRGNCADFFSCLVKCQSFGDLLDCLEQRYGAAGSEGWRILPLLGSEALKQANKCELIEGWSEYARVEAVDQLLDALGLVQENRLGRELMEACAFLHELRERIEPRLREQSCELGICNFDSLVDLLYQRLCGQAADPTLRAWLRKRYRVALIDEFQDTDRRQWGIISAIFHDAQGTGTPPQDREEERHNTIVVGDPKQSIYGFRGVNPHTYKLACDQMNSRYRLDINYRSKDELVYSCNTLFNELWKNKDDQGREPFQSVRGSGKHKRKLCRGDEIEPPFTWLDCDAGGEDKLNLDGARTQVFLAIRSQVARLLSEEYHWDTPEDSQVEPAAPRAECADLKPKVKPSDIAVLLDQNNYCQQLHQLLAEWSIPTTISLQESIFTSLEAELLSLWLQLLQDPQQQGPLRLLLLSPLWGLRPEQLFFFEESLLQDLAVRQCFTWRGMINEGKLSQVLEQFCTWGSRLASALHQEAPDSLRQQLQQDVRHRLLLLPGGDRNFADLAQLFEWLQQQQFQHRHDALSLARVFQQAREAGNSEDEQRQRLEADCNTVKLLTGHAAKGLEFPVVFVVLGFKGNRRGSLYLYHREREQVVDLSASPAAQEKEQLEQSAEFQRLFYVGITRAKFKLYLPYCLDSAGDKFYPHHLQSLKPLCSADAHFHFQQARLLPRPPELLLADDWVPARCFSRSIKDEPQPGNSSFTSLTRVEGDEDLPSDKPAVDEEGEDLLLDNSVADRMEYDRRSLSGGASLGILLHALLEKIDFAAGKASFNDFCQSTALRECLRQEARLHFNDQWLDRAEKVLLELLWHTLNTPLSPCERDTLNTSPSCCNLRLCQLDAIQRRHELKFLLHITQPNCSLVLDDFRADLRPGVLEGVIDLVFRWEGKIYLLDWKSNHALVGTDGQADWSEGALRRLMLKHRYSLQYHLYLAALWRKIGGGEQCYEREFGGCYYLFLRGLDVSLPGQGVFFHRPSWQELLDFSAPFGLAAS